MPGRRKPKKSISDPRALEIRPRPANGVEETDVSLTKTTGVDDDPNATPQCWPAGVRYIKFPETSPFLSQEQKNWLRRRPNTKPAQRDDEVCQDDLPKIKLPQTRVEVDSTVEVRIVQDKLHPAFGQRGLFAARDLVPGEIVLPYIGYVHSSTSSEKLVLQGVVSEEEKNCTSDTGRHREDQIGSWDTSSYDLNLYRDEDIELAVDAAAIGNEARFCNDYRGVPSADPITKLNDQWGRNAKRAAKGRNHEVADSAASEHDRFTLHMAIPNVEFRDVWFEWQAEDYITASMGSPTAIPNAARIQRGVTTRHDSGPSNPSIDNTGPLSMPTTEIPSGPPKHVSRKRKVGMRGVAICVLPAGKSGKRKHGIKAGQELLVSYGKGFWAHHDLSSSQV